MYSGNILIQFRKRFHLSQEQLAEILNTSRQRISRIEHNEVDIYFKEVRLLCEKFDNYFIKLLETNEVDGEHYLLATNQFIENKENFYDKLSIVHLTIKELNNYLLKNVTKMSKN